MILNGTIQKYWGSMLFLTRFDIRIKSQIMVDNFLTGISRFPILGFVLWVDLRGQTPLSLALLLERDEVAQRLLELGADPRTILGDGWSILELMCAQCKARDDLRHSIMNLYIHKVTRISCFLLFFTSRKYNVIIPGPPQLSVSLLLLFGYHYVLIYSARI